LAIALCLAGIAYWQRAIAVRQRGIAQQNEAQASDNESRALAALSTVATKNGFFTDSVNLALASWPRAAGDPRPRLATVLENLAFSLSSLVPVLHEYRHDGTVNGALLNRDETRILSWSSDGTACGTSQRIGRSFRR
jgi:hypothetical protein